MFLSDPQWLLLQPILASTTTRGRPPANNRLILEQIFWKFTNDRPWYDIPSVSPSWQTCYQHYQRWKNTGTWKSILLTLTSDLQERGGLDLLQAHQNHEITIARNCSGQLQFDYSPHLAGTWQLSTAILILILLASGL